MKLKLAKILLCTALGLSANLASAVSFDSTWAAFRNNTAGTTFFVLPTAANHFCFLTGVTVQETDVSTETAQCRLRTSNGTWLLEAILGFNGDADVRCEAQCYNN